MSGAREERSLGELFGELARETTTLIRQEIALAKNELGAKARQAGRAGAIVAAGALLAMVALIVLAGAAVAAIATSLPIWLSALLVGLVLGGLAYSFIQKGTHDLKRIEPAPRETLETLKEHKQWAKELTQ